MLKLNELSNPDRPRFAVFKELGDRYILTIVDEPAWVPDPLDPDRRMLKVVGRDDDGVFWQLNGRTQMPDAIFDAAARAGVEEIVADGRLTVEFVDVRGKAKIYHAVYEPPEVR